MFKNEGLCPRRDKKKENSRKVNCIQKLNKKKGGEPKVKPDIVLDAILLRRPRSAGPFPRTSPRFPKKSLIQNRKGSRAADEDTNIIKK
jgi:hypothetical protein